MSHQVLKVFECSQCLALGSCSKGLNPCFFRQIRKPHFLKGILEVTAVLGTCREHILFKNTFATQCVCVCVRVRACACVCVCARARVYVIAVLCVYIYIIAVLGTLTKGRRQHLTPQCGAKIEESGRVLSKL